MTKSEREKTKER